MVSRTAWLDEGLNVLAAHGHTALVEDRLCERLGVEPGAGSFREHFDDEAGFHRALLTHVEAGYTDKYIEHADRSGQEPDGSLAPRARLVGLAEVVLSDSARPDLEVAMRSWARHHPEAEAVQERIDRRRVEHVRGLIEEAVGDPERAERLARLMYLVLVGGRQVVPAASHGELRDYFALAMASIEDAETPDQS